MFNLLEMVIYGTRWFCVQAVSKNIDFHRPNPAQKNAFFSIYGLRGRKQNMKLHEIASTTIIIIY